MSKCPICQGKQELSFHYQGFDYLRCSECQLMSTYPLPTAEQIESHYAKRFERGNYELLQKYADKYRAIYEGYVELLNQAMASQNRKLEGASILDVGCFTGDFLNLMKDRGADVYGLELQDKAVEIANQRLPGKVFKADVFSNDFPTGPFDIVTLLGVVEHVPDPSRLLERCTALLKPGGFLMVQTPDSGSSFARLMGKYWPPYAPVEHIHLFSRSSLGVALKNLGYEKVRFKQHWKSLPIGYVYNMMENFGPEFHRLLSPIYKHLPKQIAERQLPFYVGEFLAIAQK